MASRKIMAPAITKYLALPGLVDGFEFGMAATGAVVCSAKVTGWDCVGWPGSGSPLW